MNGGVGLHARFALAGTHLGRVRRGRYLGEPTPGHALTVGSRAVLDSGSAYNGRPAGPLLLYSRFALALRGLFSSGFGFTL